MLVLTTGKYKIPKDTWVVVNHWAIHYSDKHWDEPFKFKPGESVTLKCYFTICKLLGNTRHNDHNDKPFT